MEDEAGHFHVNLFAYMHVTNTAQATPLPIPSLANSLLEVMPHEQLANSDV